MPANPMYPFAGHDPTGPQRPLSGDELATFLATVERWTAATDTAGREMSERQLQTTYLALATLRARLALTMLAEAIRAAAANPDAPAQSSPAHHQSHTMMVAGPGEPGHEPVVMLPDWSDGMIPRPPTPDELPVHRPNRSHRHEVVEPGPPVVKPIAPPTLAESWAVGYDQPGGSALVMPDGAGKRSRRRR